MSEKETDAGKDVRAILSQNIKRFRAHREWSQAELADRADISIPFLSDIERGNKWPYPDTLSNLAKALHVEVYELFRRTKPPDDKANDFVGRIMREVLVAMNQVAENIQKEYSL
jgi:transcriptional regulator with XRE-family HTH domain